MCISTSISSRATLAPELACDWERLAREAQFSAAQMAALLRISERHLQRLFKKKMRCSPSCWLRELKCRMGKELISRGYTSKGAAAELEFATVAHFCREFKKVFGAPPQSFAPSRLGYLSLLALKARTPAREEPEWDVVECAREGSTETDLSEAPGFSGNSRRTDQVPQHS